MKKNFYVRRSKFVRLILLSLLVVQTATVYSRAYYFSATSGNDSYTVTQAQNPSTPWRSLAKLNSMMSSFVAGDSLLLQRGNVFYGSITLTRSGLIVTAYGSGANPVVSGFQELSFVNVGANLWESTQTLPVQPQTFLYNGTYQLPGRFPNNGYRTITNSTAANLLEDNQLSGDWTGGEVVARKNNWTTDKGRITGQSGGTVTYSNTSGDWHQNGWGYFIQNHPSALDLNGEWYYNSTTQKVVVYSTSQPVNTKAGQVARLVQLNNVSATFNGLDFEGSNDFSFHLNNAGGTVVTNCSVLYSGSFAFYAANSNNLRVENCTIRYTNNVGFLLAGCRPAIIRNNQLFATGIEGGGRGLNVTNLEYSAMSISSGDGSIIQGNRIEQTGYNAIHFLFGSNYLIQHNYIDGFNLTKDDGAGIYTWNAPSNPSVFTGTRIDANIVLNGKAAPGGRPSAYYLPAYGIYMDDNAAFVDITNNVVADCAGSGIFLHNAHDLSVRGNLVYNCGSASADPAGAGQFQVLGNSSYYVRNVRMYQNQYVSRRSNQLVVKWDTDYNDIQQFGQADSNYYCRPINDNQVFRLYSQPWSNALSQTLTDWRNFTGQDANSRRSPKTVTSMDSLRFVYNETSSPKLIPLSGTFLDVRGTEYAGSITLAPYSGAVLIYKSGTINQSPTANAGPNRTITLPTNSTTLNGSGTDPDGTISSFAWTRLSGPVNFTIGSPTAAATTVANLVQGTYQFVLTVTDNLGATGRDTVQVTVNPAPNQAPTANAGLDRTITLPTNSTTLNGSGTDVDGSVASFAWSRLAGPTTFTINTPAAATTTISNLVQGTYRFVLTVTDNQGAVGRDTVQVVVNPAPNSAPSAFAGPDQVITLPVNTVSKSGSGMDSDGSIASFAWSRLSGPTTFTINTPAAATTTISNLVQGTYQFVLTVTDNQGAVGRDTVQVLVNPAPNVAPTANAGPDRTITLPTNSTTLNGSGTDVDGTIASFAWSRLSGPTTFTINTPAAATTTISNMVQGTYQFVLTVTDNQGAVGRDTVQVTVNPAPNQAPTANAGLDRTITLPTNSTTLNGSGTDVDGSIASFAWSRLSGPTTFTINTPNTATTTVSNLVQGTYQFVLNVTDNQGAVGRDTVQVLVNPAPNVAPTANAGPDRTITLPTNSTTLTGSGTDVDGTIASFAWSRISGPATFTINTPSAATTTISNLVQGTYQFVLTVTDNQGAVGRDTVQVLVNPAPNVAPTANAGPDRMITLPTNSTTLNGSGTDVDGTIASFAWSRLSGPTTFTINTPTAATTTISNLVQGTYQFVLTVTDNQGAVGRDTVQVLVNPAPNVAPTANAGPDRVITLPTNSTTLNGTGTDVDGSIASFVWSRISGPATFTINTPSAATTTISNLVQGTYQFVLTVTDNQGAVGRDTVQVLVNPAPNQAPTANAGPDRVITLPTNSTTLNGSGTDVDGTIASFAWSRLSGPTTFTINTPAAATTTISNLVQGTYQFILTVTDNQGAVGRDTVQVLVNPASNVAPTANAGLDQSITLPVNTVSLTGSGTDTDGSIASYAWSKIAGPSSFTIVNAGQSQTDVTNLTEGVYLFVLTVTDNQGAVGRDTVQVTVNPAPNQPPVVYAGIDQTIQMPFNYANLTGMASDDDGSVVSVQWVRVSGPATVSILSPANITSQVIGFTEGSFQFALIAMDDQGAVASDTMTVLVMAAPNVLPTANAGPDRTITLPANSTTLNGSGSDVDGSIASFAWTKIAGPAAFTIVSPNAATTNITNLVQGTYRFVLTVTDNRGANGRDTVQVTVNPAPNVAPTANAGPDRTITLPTNNITLIGTGTDVDGSIASFAWTKIAGPAAFTIVSPNAATTNITNLVQGTYRFVLTVTDNQGAIGRDTVQVLVNPAPNVAPTANAGPDRVITLPTNSTTLNGSGSDVDGTIASFAWSRISGPATFTINTPSAATTTISNLVQGTYQFVLTVTDNQGAVGRDTVQVLVNPAPNVAPTANAGLDRTITLPTNSTTLNGSGTDVDGTIASFAWSRLSGPATFTINTPSSATTTISNLVQGTYQFVLTVTDNQGAVGRDTVQVLVNPAPNVAPTANAGPDRVITLPTNSTTLNGSGTDVDGTIASFAWSRLSGPATFTINTPSSATTTISNLVQGTYQFVLTVTDNQGAVGRDTVQVLVNPAPNVAPTANAGPDRVITLPTNSTTLNGSGSDVDGTIASFAWSRISGPATFTINTPSAATTTISNLVQGTYQFVLTVTDNQGAFGRDTVQVLVNPAPNVAPTANAGPDRTITLPTNSATLNGSGSDVDGSIASFAWSRLSGPTTFTINTPTAATTTISNLVQGTYRFVLTVTDNQGAFGRDTVQVLVNPAPNQAPTANAGPDRMITLPTNSTTLNGSGSDVDGSIASFAWSRISGPATFTIGTPSAATTSITNLVQGTYQFVLTVTDNQGAVGRDTVQVTVNPATNVAPTANAGPDRTITLPTNSITLNGIGTDADGTITSFAWSRTSGPASFVINAPLSATTTISNLVQGTYQFVLTVTDNQGAVGRDTVQVTVNPAPNQAPTANAGPDRTITLPTNSTTLNGSGTDVDGSIASFAWSRISGPAAITIGTPGAATTTISNLVQGTYHFVLTVTDNQGAIGRDTVQVTVNGVPNAAPLANAGPDRDLTLPYNTAALSGSGLDTDGSITSYQWRRIEGPASYHIVSPQSSITSVTDLVEGMYRFELTVTDNQGATGADTVVVRVLAAPSKVSVSTIYPNPAVSFINLSLKPDALGGRTLIRIFDGRGRMVFQERIQRTVNTVQLHTIQVSRFTSGLYRLELRNETGDSEVLSFVKE